MQQSKLISFVLLVLFAAASVPMVSAQAATQSMTDTDTQTGNERNEADLADTSETGDATEDMSDQSSEIIELEQVSVTA